MALSKFFRSIQASKRFKSTVRYAVETAFGKHLLFTNIWTSAVLMFIGDIAQQEIEYQRHMLPERYDWHRLWRMTVVGIGYGPLHHYFYIGIYKLWPKRTFPNIGKKIFADQVVMTPVGIAFLFYCAGLMEGKTWKGCTHELMDKWVEVYTVDWCVWPPAQFVNFYYFPVKYQVLFINFVTMLYNLYLSYIKHKEVAQQHLKDYKAVEFTTTEVENCSAGSVK